MRVFSVWDEWSNRPGPWEELLEKCKVTDTSVTFVDFWTAVKNDEEGPPPATFEKVKAQFTASPKAAAAGGPSVSWLQNSPLQWLLQSLAFNTVALIGKCVGLL